MHTNQSDKIGIPRILEINTQNADEFCSPATAAARRLHHQRHPTEILAFKCMDGRVHLPLWTNTPPGIIQPFRNLGGRFNLGWPLFREIILEQVNYGVRKGRRTIALITYHFSRAEKSRGCSGFNHDTDAAQRTAAELCTQFTHVFGNGGAVSPVLVGLETDYEAFVLHGENGERVDMLDHEEHNDLNTPDAIIAFLRVLYPTMPTECIVDLAPLVSGNLAHVRHVRAAERPITEVQHQEWMLCVGRGFDWLHSPNTALIVGPFNPDLIVPTKTAAQIVLNNLQSGRIAGQQPVLVACAPYRDPAGGFERRLAEEKARFLMDDARKTVGAEVPELAHHLHTLTATVNTNTRRLTVLEQTQ